MLAPLRRVEISSFVVIVQDTGRADKVHRAQGPGAGMALLNAQLVTR